MHLRVNLGLACLSAVFLLCSRLIAAPKLSLSGSSYQIGEPVVVQFSGTSKNSRDWIGLFKEGRKLTRSQAEAWLYLDGTTVGYSGLSSGSLSFPEQGLSKTANASSLVTLWSKHKRLLSRERAKEMSAKSISLDGNKLRYLQKVFGSAPREGRSLWISLHGGGSAPASVNDQQWRNQIELYQPAEGYYVAPRAPTDSWNMWFKPHITPLFDRLIENYVVKYRVNPNKVYVLGYSAGGDGVYQIGPRMADRWAAASMMAGHPNDAQPVNLRNIGFGLFMGANDSSYNRNGMAEKWKGLLSNLRKADPDGYQHRVRIYPGLGHWMNLRDAESIPWMAKFRRNPWPGKVVWRQDGVVQTRFYWLSVAKSDHVNGRRIEATVNGQTISLTAKNTKRVTVRLSDSLVNLDEELTVKFNGPVKFNGTVSRLKSELSRSLAERADNTSAASAKITVGSDKNVWINGRRVDEVFLDTGEYRIVLFQDDSNKALASARFHVIPKRPKLKGVRNPDGSLTLIFEGSLEYGPTVAGPWRTLNWSSPRTVSITSKQRFFRSKN